MQKEARNAERSNRASVRIQIFFIVIDIPVYACISDHIHPCIIQCWNVHQDNRRAIGLHSLAFKEIIVVFHENLNRNLFIGVIAGKIDTDKGNKADFRMCP